MVSQVKTTHFWFAWIVASLLVYPLIVVFLIAFGMLWTPITEALFSDSLTYGFGTTTTLEEVYFLLISSLLGGIVGLAIGLLQQAVINSYFPIEIKHWRRTTIAGGMIAAPIMFFTFSAMGNYVNDNYWQLLQAGHYNTFSTIVAMIPMVMYVLLMSAVQVWILRHYVNHAWLWIIANAVAGLMFSMLVSNAFEPGFGDWLLAAIAQGAVTGFAMLWLLHRLNKDTDTDDREFAYQHVRIDEDNDFADPSMWNGF